MVDLLWKNRINALCYASHLWAYSVLLDKCHQRAFVGITEIRRVSCMCAADGNEQVKAHWLHTLTM